MSTEGLDFLFLKSYISLLDRNWYKDPYVLPIPHHQIWVYISLEIWNHMNKVKWFKCNYLFIFVLMLTKASQYCKFQLEPPKYYWKNMIFSILENMGGLNSSAKHPHNLPKALGSLICFIIVLLFIRSLQL